MTYAERVTGIEASATLAISAAARRLENNGVDVVDLSVGEPDFETPEPIREAGKAAIDAGHTGYTQGNGIPALRDAISDKLASDGFELDPEQLIVTPGAKHALYISMQTLVDAGDEVVLFDPAWVSYAPMVDLAGGDLTRIDLTPHEFQLAPALEDLKATVDESTSVLLLNSPNNPSGAVYSASAIEAVRDLAVEYDFTVLSDEIYQSISYDRSPTSIGSLDGMAGRTVTINGFSKAYAMTGWRLGYLAGPEDFVDEASKVQSHSVTCATNFVQHAGVTALRDVEEDVGAMVDAFQKRRNLLVDLLTDHGVSVGAPAGAFYLLVPVDADDQAWCETAIEDAHVATVPGSAFGVPGYARFSYANSQARIREGISRLVESGLLRST